MFLNFTFEHFQNESEVSHHLISNWNDNPIVFLSLILATVFCETFGNFGLLCLILFEKYGMDSLKRNVTNQLASSICMAGIFTFVFIGPGLLYRLLIGPVPTFLGIWVAYGSLMSFLFSLFTLTQQSVLKCLYISYFSRLAPISDYFIAIFLNIFNFILAVMLSLMCLLAIQGFDPFTSFMVGNSAPIDFSFQLQFVFM